MLDMQKAERVLFGEQGTVLVPVYKDYASRHGVHRSMRDL